MKSIHSIIIIKQGNKFLNYYDERWKIFLFPNIKGNDTSKIKEIYNTDKVKFLFDKVHDKYSVSSGKIKTYHHYFYEVSTDVKGKYFSLEELLKDAKIKKYNGDIINFISDYYN